MTSRNVFSTHIREICVYERVHIGCPSVFVFLIQCSEIIVLCIQ